MLKHLKEYAGVYILVVVFIFLADYTRVVCCEESDQVCHKCQDYLGYYFGEQEDLWAIGTIM